jgi:tetratricopeptide (TPR) repeat protein
MLIARTGAAPEELAELRRHLEATIRDETAAADRARAALVLARLAPWLGSRTTALEMLQVVQELPLTELDLTSTAEARCAIARLAYEAGRKDVLIEEIACLEDAANRLNTRGYWGRTGYAVTAHLGVALLTIGEYEKALGFAQRALHLAQRRGNGYDIAAQMVNIAVALGRLGRYTEQDHWASLALREGVSIGDPLMLCRAAYYACVSKALLGEDAKVADLLAQYMSEPLSLGAEWVRQSRSLLRADVLALLGRYKDAKRCALDGIALAGGMPLSEQCRGAVARWLAVAGPELYGEDEVRQRLRDMLGEIHTLDLIDRAELLAAANWMDRHTGRAALAPGEALEDVLLRLPRAARDQVSRLLPG